MGWGVPEKKVGKKGAGVGTPGVGGPDPPTPSSPTWHCFTNIQHKSMMEMLTYFQYVTQDKLMYM